MEITPPLPRLSTGIPGLDPILEGGFLRGGAYIVQGPPGSGKTILANQVCTHHAREGGKSVYFTLLAESHSRMIGHMRRLAFFDPSLVGNSLVYLAGYKILEEEGLSGFAKVVRASVAER